MTESGSNPLQELRTMKDKVVEKIYPAISRLRRSTLVLFLGVFPLQPDAFQQPTIDPGDTLPPEAQVRLYEQYDQESPELAEARETRRLELRVTTADIAGLLEKADVNPETIGAFDPSVPLDTELLRSDEDYAQVALLSRMLAPYVTEDSANLEGDESAVSLSSIVEDYSFTLNEGNPQLSLTVSVDAFAAAIEKQQATTVALGGFPLGESSITAETVITESDMYEVFFL